MRRRTLAEDDSRMIVEIFAERPVGAVDGISQNLSVEPIVFPAVFEFLANALTDDDSLPLLFKADCQNLP
jgi:hypothetical protein